MLICIDCDEVLCCFVAGINAWHNRVHHTSLTPAAYHSTHFAKVPGWGDDLVADAKVQAFFAGSPEWLGLAPVPGACEALQALRRAWPQLQLQVVTARSSKQGGVTQAFLDAHFPGVFSGVHYLSAYDNALHLDAPARSKGEVCAELGALALVDDSPSYCTQASPHLPLVLLFSRVPWNTGQAAWERPQLPCNVVRAPSWGLAGALLHRLCAAAASAGAPARALAPPQPIPFVLPHGTPVQASALGLCARAYHSLAAQCFPAAAAGAGAAASADAGSAWGGAAQPAVPASALGQGSDSPLLLALELHEGALDIAAPLEDAAAAAELDAAVQALVGAGRATVSSAPDGVLRVQLVL
jgi:hypothetical protein